MAVNGVEIKVGQVWRSRNGSQWEIIGPYEGGDWAWLAKQIGGASVGAQTNFSEDGLFWPKTSSLNRGPHESDLVFLVSDPAIGTERRQRQTENSPLRRKDDFPPVPADLPDLTAPPAEFAASVPGMLEDTPGVREAIDSPPFVPGMLGEPIGTNIFDRIGDSLHRDAKEVGEAIDQHVESVRSSALLDQPDIETIYGKPSSRYAKSNAEALADENRRAAEAELSKHSALDVQIGGGHYKQFAIQPVEFIHKNGIPFIEGNCIKYLARWRDKGGIEDLKKVKHYIDLLIEMESKK